MLLHAPATLEILKHFYHLFPHIITLPVDVSFPFFFLDIFTSIVIEKGAKFIFYSHKKL